MDVWKLGIDSSLSIVPPVYANPLPAIIGTMIPRDDNMGAKIKEILSPIPPVLCLSATYLSMLLNLNFSPELTIELTKEKVSESLIPLK